MIKKSDLTLKVLMHGMSREMTRGMSRGMTRRRSGNMVCDRP